MRRHSRSQVCVGTVRPAHVLSLRPIANSHPRTVCILVLKLLPRLPSPGAGPIDCPFFFFFPVSCSLFVITSLQVGLCSVSLGRVVSIPSSQHSTCSYRSRRSSRAYRRSFSIRSTCVISILRQQYRLQPSWSIASLSSISLRICISQNTVLHTRRGHRRPEASDTAPTGLQPPRYQPSRQLKLSLAAV